MAPKKKSGKNGFYYFMIDFKQSEEARGVTFQGLQDVAKYASPKWTAMTLEEKAPYIRKASRLKGSDAEDSTKKFTSLGVSFATIDAEDREKEEAKNIMEQTIRNTVRSLHTQSTLLIKKFHLCHVNYLYKSEAEVYAPVELAISEFNLEQGLIDTLHFIIDPGKVPLGHRFEARDWSEKTHGIPPDSGQGERDYYKIYQRVRNFLTKDKPAQIPPVYTMPDSLNNNMCMSAVKSAFISLCEAANESTELFRVYSFPLLFFELRNKCVVTEDGNLTELVPSVAIMESEIEKDVFSYARDLGCEFHEEKDLSLHCSLSIVTRWVYTVCDHCCKHVGISLSFTKHCPKDADLNWEVGRRSKPAMVPLLKGRTRDKFLDKEEKAKTSFMPTIIDHGKIKEIREREFMEEKKRFQKSEEIRPPHSTVPVAAYRNIARGSTSSPVPGLNNVDFPEIGQERRIGGIPPVSGRGRGSLREIPQPSVWPVSGRGRIQQ